jgi:type II secretory ATPase GspE/PulE/Tfp pilus assembly ATPase PilB-like protein
MNPIGRIAHRVILNAIDANICLIEIKLDEGRMLVYYHSEGGVHEEMNIPGSIFPKVVTRYKLWADVDLLNRRYL